MSLHHPSPHRMPTTTRVHPPPTLVSSRSIGVQTLPLSKLQRELIAGPKVNHIDTLQNDATMNRCLNGYHRLKDIAKVPSNTLLRYITIDPKKQQKVFRLGGHLIWANDKEVLLTSGNFCWKVQRYHTLVDGTIYETVWFKKQSPKHGASMRSIVSELQTLVHELGRRCMQAKVTIHDIPVQEVLRHSKEIVDDEESQNNYYSDDDDDEGSETGSEYTDASADYSEYSDYTDTSSIADGEEYDSIHPLQKHKK